jgi:peptidoglycan/LPS O-acetylase OafA/YrhL
LATQLAAQVTFTWNWLMAFTESAVARGFSVTWSVAIEEWFYLLAPWILVTTPRRHLVSLLISLGILSIVARAAAYLWLGSAHSLAPYILPPFRLDGLCAGGLLALAIRNEGAKALLQRNASTIAKCALAFVITTPLLIGLMRSDLDRQMYLWGHTYLTVGFSVILVWALLNVGSRQSGLLRAWPLREAGRYSYTLYLFHPLFISLLFTLGGESREIVTGWSTLCLAIAALLSSIAFSIGFYWVVERRAVALGHRTKYEVPSPTASGQAQLPG